MDAWALLSVSDKRDLDALARYLTEAGLKLLATASTAKQLRSAGWEVASVEDLTGFGEILGGRVKTLHPLIYGGLLASSQPDHQAQRQAIGAPDIRVVVVNLYPFEQALEQGAAIDDLIEEIDIGGVSLIRAAAKNYQRVAVLVSVDQYAEFMKVPWKDQNVSFRRRLAVQAFFHAAYYDAMIGEALTPASAEEWPVAWALAGARVGTLRYGENPHQKGAFYRYPVASGFAAAQILQGKPLSYNNLADADTAVTLAYGFDDPAAVAVKHQTPCAAALGQDVGEAYRKAHDADPVSIFGGIVAVNRPVDQQLATMLNEIFLEVVIAPDYSPEALGVLSAKKNLRVLKMASEPIQSWEVKGIWGGFLIQRHDQFVRERSQWTRAAGPDPRPDQLSDIELAWKTAAQAKSNAIVVAKDGVTLGIGSGETNRIDAARHALERAGNQAQGAVLASDGFFPFDDVMRLAQESGVALVVQPGGSIRDKDSVAVAQAAGITLIMTGERHFRH